MAVVICTIMKWARLFDFRNHACELEGLHRNCYVQPEDITKCICENLNLNTVIFFFLAYVYLWGKPGKP